MNAATRLLPLLAVMAVVVVLAVGMARMVKGPEDVRRLRAERDALERRIADLESERERIREIVWQHRDIAPEVATILLDEMSKPRKKEGGR